MKKSTKLLITAALSLVALSFIIYTNKNEKPNSTEVIDIRNNDNLNVTFSEPMNFSKMINHYAETTYNGLIN